ncbi:MAG: hypothetical protein IPJ77_24725 [Planctomycetes bacterium]|nr:hypothetical protein [Planctomycetota bacterium]
MSRSSTTANLVLPGTQYVRHEFVLEDGPVFQSGVVVVSPRAEAVHPGVPFSCRWYRTHLSVAGLGEELPASYSEDWLTSHPSVSLPPEHGHFVGFWNPLRCIETRLRLEQIENGGLRYVVTGETREYAWPPLVNVVVPIALVAAGVTYLVRSRRRASAA